MPVPRVTLKIASEYIARSITRINEWMHSTHTNVNIYNKFTSTYVRICTSSFYIYFQPSISNILLFYFIFILTYLCNSHRITVLLFFIFFYFFLYLLFTFFFFFPFFATIIPPARHAMGVYVCLAPSYPVIRDRVRAPPLVKPK